MRFSDLLQIAIKNIKGRWAIFVTFGIVISTFCLCHAGMVFVYIQQEKSASFELIVSTESSEGITETVLAEISKVADVKDTTPVIQIPVQMEIGEYRASLTLTGIKPSYLSNRSVMPEESVMPYIVLNEASCKLFSKNNEEAATSVPPQIDWMNTKATIFMDEGNIPVISKICCILANKEDKEPAAYISLDVAKSLLKANEQLAIYQSAFVRIKNIGCAKNVIKTVDALQLTATNADIELQAKWDSETKEMLYLIVLGVFNLLYSVILLFAWRIMVTNEQQNTYAMLHWIGIKTKNIAEIFTLQIILITLIGISIGIVMCMLVNVPF